jgi:hypothetical protein
VEVVVTVKEPSSRVIRLNMENHEAILVNGNSAACEWVGWNGYGGVGGVGSARNVAVEGEDLLEALNKLALAGFVVGLLALAEEDAKFVAVKVYYKVAISAQFVAQ